jgi:hypothetical protein
LIDQALIQTGQRRDNLDSGAGLEAALERQFLVYDGQEAAGAGVDDYNTSVIGTEGLHGCSPDYQILSVNQIPFSRIRECGR